MDEGSNEKIVKLLSDFLDYYEVYFQEEISSTEKSYRGMPFSELYKKCKSIILREKEIVTSNICREIVEDVKEKFSSEYLKNQIDLMMKMCDESPTDAIGKSKDQEAFNIREEPLFVCTKIGLVDSLNQPYKL